MNQAAQFLHLAGTDKRFWIGFDQSLRQTGHTLGAGRMGQAFELIKRTVERPSVIPPLDANQNSALGLRRCGNKGKPSH